MRIVQLNPFYFPYAGGIERRMRALAQGLAKRHDMHIVTAALPEAPAGTTEEDGVTIHRLPSHHRLGRFYNPPFVSTPGVYDKLRRLRPDVIDYHSRWAPSYNHAFRDAECARVITYHNTFGEGDGAIGLMSQLNDRLYRRTMKHANRIVAVSQHIKRDLAARGTPEDLIRVVYNAIDPPETGSGFQRPKHAPDGPYVMGLGRMVGIKGFDIAVDAFDRIPGRLHLVLIGAGPAREGLLRQAGGLGIRSRVHAPGWVSEEEKVRLLRNAVCLVHPARSEAFGLVVLEAMALGTPVITSDVGGLPEVVGDAGVIIEPDAKALAEAIQDLVRDDDRWNRLSQAGRKQAQVFRWEDTVQQQEAVYEEAVDDAS